MLSPFSSFFFLGLLLSLFSMVSGSLFCFFSFFFLPPFIRLTLFFAGLSGCCFGFAFFLLGAFHFRHRYWTVSMGKTSVSISDRIIAAYASLYFRDKLGIPVSPKIEVEMHSDRSFSLFVRDISALPFSSVQLQQVEQELAALLRQVLGYHRCFQLTFSFTSPDLENHNDE